MGPLIPQGIVNPDLNLFFAFVIGLGFGYVLEQGGFSNARKLAGVFYGYDFVVLRVFFTAAITAMLGISLFHYAGLIDQKLLYINPTFVWSALLGGVIMGFGFIMGGFCPGTSMVAAVIGKIDAMFFILGMIGGIFFFGSSFGYFEPIYNGSALGGVLVYDSIGMSRDWFILLLVVAALAAFIITRKIEDHINSIPNPYRLFHPSYTIPFIAMAGISLLVVLLPSQPASKWYEVSAETLIEEAVSGKQYIEHEELAFKLLHPQENDLTLVDVREPEDFNEFSLPGATNIPLNSDAFLKQAGSLLESDNKVLFYGFSSSQGDQAWMLLRRHGYQQAHVLDGGLNGFFNYFFGDREAKSENPELNQFSERFRNRVIQAFRTGEAAVKTPTAPKPVKTIIEIQTPPPGKGGC
jgi:rhodanese-related sulfurtransferase